MNKFFIIGKVLDVQQVVSKNSTLAHTVLKCEIDSGEKKNPINIDCWNKTAELALKYLSYGRKVLVEGTIRPSEYKSYINYYFYADKIEFLGGGNKDEHDLSAKPTQDKLVPIEDNDDIPF